jgi:hypothetical protein
MAHTFVATTAKSDPYTFSTAFSQNQVTAGFPQCEYPVSANLDPISMVSNPFHWPSKSQNPSLKQPHKHPRLSRDVVGTRQFQRPKLKLIIDNGTRFKCYIDGCVGVLSRRQGFKARIAARYRTTQADSSSCKDCGRIFTRKANEEIHRRTVYMREKNHRCVFCLRFFARKDSLRR